MKRHNKLEQIRKDAIKPLTLKSNLTYAYEQLGHFGLPASKEYERMDRGKGRAYAQRRDSAQHQERERMELDLARAKANPNYWDTVAQILDSGLGYTLEQAKQMALLTGAIGI